MALAARFSALARAKPPPARRAKGRRRGRRPDARPPRRPPPRPYRRPRDQDQWRGPAQLPAPAGGQQQSGQGQRQRGPAPGRSRGTGCAPGLTRRGPTAGATPTPAAGPTGAQTTTASSASATGTRYDHTAGQLQRPSTRPPIGGPTAKPVPMQRWKWPGPGCAVGRHRQRDEGRRERRAPVRRRRPDHPGRHQQGNVGAIAAGAQGGGAHEQAGQQHPAVAHPVGQPPTARAAGRSR